MRLLWGSLGVLSVAVACSSSSGSSGEVAESLHSLTCSNGTPYTGTNGPPIGDARPAGDLPTCVSHCGTESFVWNGSGLGGRPMDAVPTGACEAEGDQCTMGASNYIVCDGRNYACNLSEIYCACRSGQWQCTNIAQGGGMCASCGALTGTSGGTFVGTDAGQ